MATMAAIEGLLLLVMAVVGALCAVQDIRKSIVPNCWIAAGIMIAAVLQTIDQLFFAREYGAWWLANMAVGDALAILMYGALGGRRCKTVFADVFMCPVPID